ncbi:MAG: phosphate ABC transporter, permease protein PstA [Candidatus Omnitrophica bacterium CG11_big_fil_rev_8_21_14_0_20_64_10]|nr:MAG: phosphate ABC transporter, permease protein PstA [Candidatus Omnitrophica bacterium CG11_big_fil_rev_8_21_14_0_20_64_10]
MVRDPLMARRNWANRLALASTGLCALVTVSVLFFLLGYIAVNGIGALNWAFFTQLPKPVGEPGGGMANAIVGTGKLLFLASLIGVPIGFFGGVYLAEFGRNGKIAFWVRYATDVLNGVPSIVIGIFAYVLVVLPMKSFSTLAGGFALGIMMIPIAVRTTEEFLKLIPASIREAADALGVQRWKTILFVVIPAAFRGLLTGILLDLARVAGETAPLLFTALNNRVWSHGWMEPTASLPVMIYTYAIAPYEDWHRQAWAAALVLMLLVLVVNGGARMVLPRRSVVV